MGRLTLVAALTAILLAGCGSGHAQRGIAFHVASNPFRLTVQSDGKSVVSEDKQAALSYEVLGKPEVFTLTKVISSRDGVYQVATSEQGRTATVRVSRMARGVRVSVRLHPETGVSQILDAFDAKPADHFLGGGEGGAHVDLRGQIVPIKVSHQCSAAPVPFFASSAGWGFRLDTETVAGLAFPGSTGGPGCLFGSTACSFQPLGELVEACVKGAQLDEELYAGSIPQTLAAFQASAGEPAVPPPSELGLIKWRDVVNGPGDVLGDVTRLQAARIPLETVLLDNPWETCVGTLAFDPARIPDPAGLIRKVHSLGVKFMLWVSPKVQCPASYPAADLIGPPDGHQVLNLAKPAAVAEFQRRLRKVFALGVDGVKGDRGDEVDLDALGDSAQNEYPLLFAKAVLAVLPKGGPTIFRAATVGSQQVLPGLWGGDEPETFDGLQDVIRRGESAAMSGFPTWGSDVGGYNAPGPALDVFARWAQLGAVSPVLEVGGQGLNATPWKLGATAMAALRDAATLHYELFPYLYRLLQRHQPVLRPLGYGYPDDPQAWTSDLELLVGPDLLAAPVIGSGETPSVYLPAGSWVDLYTGAGVSGGRVFIRQTPLTQFPLYVKAGAVLPFNLRTADPWWGVNEQTHPGRAGWLATDGARLELRGQPHDVQLFVPASVRPARVSIGGHAVAWTWNAGPFPGVVIRLHGPEIQGEVTLSP